MSTSATSPSLLSAFQPPLPEDWWKQVEKELKGKNFSTFFWTIEDGVVIPPYDPAAPHQPTATYLPRPQTHWTVLEAVALTEDLAAANADILTALQGGADGIQLVLHRTLSAAEWQRVLKNVILSYVTLHIHVADAKQAVPTCQTLSELALPHYVVHTDWSTDTLWQAVQHQPPTEGATTLLVVPLAATGTPATQLADALIQAERWLQTLKTLRIPLQYVPIHFSVTLPVDYFLAIAQLRALRLLWANVLAAHQAPSLLTHIHATVPPLPATDTHTNMIAATTQAMAAAIGGVESIHIVPFGEDTPLYRRLARNISHILALESHFTKMADPAMGSYYIERITDALCEKAWGLFQVGHTA